MHKIFCIVVLFTSIICSAQVGIGTANPHPSAQLDVNSNNRGFLPPRMSTTERNMISNPTPGLIIYNTSINTIEFFNGSGWVTLGSFTPYNVEGLLGTTSSEAEGSIVSSIDGGTVMLSRAASATGTLAGYGLTPNGQNDYWVIKLDQSSTIVWQKLYGGSGNDIAADIQLTADSGYIVLGRASAFGTGTFSSLSGFGGSDVVVMKLNAAGNVVWQRVYGDLGNETAQSIMVCDDGYLVAGSTTSATFYGESNSGGTDGFVIKISNNGDVVWTKLIGGTGTDQFEKIDQLSNAIFICGSSTSPSMGGVTNFGSSDGWLVKLSNDGSINWQKLYGSTMSDDFMGVVATADGGCMLAGEGGAANGSYAGAISNGNSDFGLIKIDASGNIEWKRLIGGTQDDIVNDMVESAPGSYVIIGNSRSSNTGLMTGLTNNGLDDVYIVKVEGMGGILWQQLRGGSADERFPKICKSQDGNFIFVVDAQSSNTGDLFGFTNHGNIDMWVLKILSGTGNPL